MVIDKKIPHLGLCPYFRDFLDCLEYQEKWDHMETDYQDLR